MRTRTARWGLSATVLVTAGLALTACGPNDPVSAGTSSTTPGASVTATATATATAKGGTTAGHSRPAPAGARAGHLAKPPGPADPGLRCTNQYDYAADSRDNATINSIGSSTGRCPAVSHGGQRAGKLPMPPGPADPGLRCTNQYNYAEDTRDNATINSIGSSTGTCPAVHH